MAGLNGERMRNKTITFIVQVFFDYDRNDEFSKFLTQKWIIKRFGFFHEFTLKSLLGQTFKNFRIFVLCGERFREITSKLPWYHGVEVCYDMGRSKYEKIETDYVSITRIDSDDLYHRRAIGEISRNVILTDKRECLIYRKCLMWNIYNRYIGIHYRVSPPFYTHIFPKKIYKDWDRFVEEHFNVHGQAGGRLPRTKELRPHRACVVKHSENFSLTRRELNPHVLNDEERRVLQVEGDRIILDRGQIGEILGKFSVDKKWIE